MPGRREIRILVGKAGSGKSLTLRALFLASTRSLLIDYLGEHFDGCIIESPSALTEYLVENQSAPNLRICYKPEDPENELELVCRKAIAWGNCTLYLDEIDAYCCSSQTPPWLDRVIRYGRHYDVSLVCAVRRPRAVIPRHLVTEATEFYIFHLSDPEDVAWLAEYCGEFEPIPRPEDGARSFQFWRWNGSLERGSVKLV